MCNTNADRTMKINIPDSVKNCYKDFSITAHKNGKVHIVCNTEGSKRYHALERLVGAISSANPNLSRSKPFERHFDNEWRMNATLLFREKKTFFYRILKRITSGHPIAYSRIWAKDRKSGKVILTYLERNSSFAANEIKRIADLIIEANPLFDSTLTPIRQDASGYMTGTISFSRKQ